MVIQIDTREKQRAITKITAYFDESGIKHISSKLYVGDYMNLDNPKTIVDRKQNLNELAGNVCQDKKRYIGEIKKAHDAGIKLIFLVEHSRNINTLEDVRHWKNPRLKVSPMAMSGERLYKVLSVLQDIYGVEYRFCQKSETGKTIAELLAVGK